MQSILMILLTAALWGCHKEVPMPEPPEPEEEDVFELIWSTRLNPKGTFAQAMDTRQVYKDWYIGFGDLDSVATIMAYDIETGDKKWHYRSDSWDNASINYNYLSDNILVCVTGRRVFGFDLDSREEIWEINMISKEYNRGPGKLYEGKLYMSADEKLHSANGVEHLLEIDIFTGEYNSILELPTDDVGVKGISPPTFRKTPEGTIMYYNEYPNHDSPPQDGIQSIVAYNLDTEEEVWRNDGFITEWATNSLHAPVIYEDVLMTGGDYSMYGFDINTGERIWRTKIPDKDKFASYTNTNHLVVNGKVYANGTGNNLMCLNAKTGKLIWNSTDAPNCTDNMLYYKGMLVFTSWGYGSVMVIDAMTGKTIHREKPYENSNFNNDIAYDPETDMFFTSTFKHALGFKINKPE